VILEFTQLHGQDTEAVDWIQLQNLLDEGAQVVLADACGLTTSDAIALISLAQQW